MARASGIRARAGSSPSLAITPKQPDPAQKGSASNQISRAGVRPEIKIGDNYAAQEGRIGGRHTDTKSVTSTPAQEGRIGVRHPS